MSKHGDAGDGAARPRLAEVHRELERAFDAVRAAFGSVDGEHIAGALEQLGRLLGGHFDSEERLYYPPLRALRPERAATLLGFAREHERLRAQLRRARAALAETSLARAREIFEDVATGFALHERRESALLDALEGEVARQAT